MDSGLTELEIRVLPTTSRITTSILSALPQLRSLVLGGLKMTGDMGGANLLPTPYFLHRAVLVEK